MNFRLDRRVLFGALLAVFAAALHAPAFAAWPERTIRLVVPYPPGSGTDSLARYTARRLETALGQTVIVDNRTGGNAIIAAQLVTQAKPDGYTLLFAANAPVATNVATFLKLPYDPVKDLDPVARLAFAPMVLLVPAKSPYKTISELADAIRSKPETLTYGSGSPTYRIATEYMLSLGGLKAVHVPYKGAAPAMLDLIGGQIDFAITELSGARPHIQSGQLRALAVTSPQRLPSLPDIPTVQESGFKGFTKLGWWAIFAPAGTPAPLVRQLESTLQTIYGDAETADQLKALGMTSFLAGAADLRKFQLDEIASEVHVVEVAKIPRE